MSETWEVIIFVIVAILLFFIIVGIALTIWACHKKRNRWERDSRKRGYEWGKKDNIDSGKKSVKYNVKQGNVEILDEKENGAQKSHEKKVQYNVQTGMTSITNIDEIDSNTKKGQFLHQKKNKEKNALNDNNQKDRQRETSAFEDTYQSNTTEKVKTFDERKVGISQTNKRKRLQPVSVVSTTQNSSQSNVCHLNSYANKGYSETNRVNSFQTPTVQFQQPAAIVHAIVHPRSINKSGATFPRKFTRSSYKKSYSSFRRKPTSYNWSLEATTPNTSPTWVTVPIRYKTGHRRSLTRHRSSDILYSSMNGDSELEWDSDYNRWKFKKSLPYKLSRRNLMRRSIRRRRQQKIAASSRPVNDVYITDWPAASYENRRLGTTQRNRSVKRDKDHMQQATTTHDHDHVSVPDVSKQRNVSDYYTENYKMVRRSDFPVSEKQGAAAGPDTMSITSSSTSSSDVSGKLMGPTRPTNSDNEHQMSQDRQHRKLPTYTTGSYKEYSSRTKTFDETVKKEMKERNVEKNDDLLKHNALFHETLQDVKNRSLEDEVKPGKTVRSSWLANENTFTKKHGIPVTGVPVLPREPVLVQSDS